ncbi:MAG: hypothetical protein M5R36_12980 [Deltaproteobacteria bacterium]|nr:hypothetical protein [Deltaproteobacteria bacterium]
MPTGLPRNADDRRRSGASSSYPAIVAPEVHRQLLPHFLGDGGDGNDLDEIVQVLPRLRRAQRPGQNQVLVEQRQQFLIELILAGVRHGDAAVVDREPSVLRGVRIVKINLAVGHARADVFADRTEKNGDARRHVFAGIPSRAFAHDGRARIAHAEALARAALHEEFAAGRAERHRVADERRLPRPSFKSRRLCDDDASAAHALADASRCTSRGA